MHAALGGRERKREREKPDAINPGEEPREQRQQGVGQETGQEDAHFALGLWRVRALETRNGSRRPGSGASERGQCGKLRAAGFRSQLRGAMWGSTVLCCISQFLQIPSTAIIP